MPTFRVMVALGRWVRFIFGIRACTVLVLPVYLWIVARCIWKVQHSELGWDYAFDFIVATRRLAFHGGVGVLSLIAWWALRTRWPSARIWALTASAAGMFDGTIGLGVGIAGLIAFWRPTTVAQVAAAPKRVAGDGTHRYIDLLMPIALIAGLIAAGIWWHRWGLERALPQSTLPKWLVIALAVHLGTVCHEAGHALVGWASGMALRTFQIGPFAGMVRGGRWRFSFKPAGLLGGGAVGLVPKDLEHIRGRTVLMILGGPVASLLVGSVATLLALSAHGAPWEGYWSFLSIFGTFGLLDFVANLTPVRPEALYSDGAQIVQLMSNGPWADRHLAFALVSSSLITSRRPRDYDEALLVRAANSRREGADGLHLGLFLAMHYIDSGKTDLGIAAWRVATGQDPSAADELRADTAAEMAFYEGAIAGDLERARRWWRQVESKGDSRKEVDYWKGQTAMFLVEGRVDEAAHAFRQADQLARKLPVAGVYEYDRFCLDILRGKLDDATGLQNLASSCAATTSQPEFGLEPIRLS